jgi:hypothetical protein
MLMPNTRKFSLGTGGLHFLLRFEFFHAGFEAFLSAFTAPTNFTVTFTMHV